MKITGRSLFCLPGQYSYSPFPDPETGEAIGTYTIITRAANTVMRQIHNGGPNAYRMPLFLENKDMELQWLLPDLTDQEMQEILGYELPSEALEHWPVYTIRSPKPGPDNNVKIHIWDWPNLPELGNDEDTRPKQSALF